MHYGCVLDCQSLSICSTFLILDRCTDKDKYAYRLLGVVEHMGTMRHGHYVAYVRGKADARSGGWYHVSDAHVRGVSFGEVLRSEAYILFYEKM